MTWAISQLVIPATAVFRGHCTTKVWWIRFFALVYNM
jgi:hypothetical protein